MGEIKKLRVEIKDFLKQLSCIVEEERIIGETVPKSLLHKQKMYEQIIFEN